MPKTLQNTSVVTDAAVAQVDNDEGCLYLKYDERNPTVLAATIITGKTISSTYNSRNQQREELTGADLTAIQTELDALISKIWDQLKLMGKVDFV